ncbi:MAG TPA: hypothetical protein VGP79_07790 [Bryobacteraceae bacterium]|nr:hypothetical protein [Bryobacteraceae bacterium]
MKLAKFWARGSEEFAGQRATARGWSNTSVEDAREVARKTAARVAQKLAAGGEKGQYLYGDRPLPEPIIREFVDASGATRAAVTRNAYGALVLNTRDMMFIDIDREDAAPPAPAAETVQAVADLLSSGLRSLFGKSAPSPTPSPLPPPPPAPVSAIPPEISAVIERHQLSTRVYKTAAGYRVMVTDARYSSDDTRTQALLQQFGSDPLYVRLCSMQQSFRARLTPKPWRCDMGMPPVTFPFETPQAEAQYAEWVRKYTAATRMFATCRFLDSTGDRVEPDFEELIAFHDQETKAKSSMPLA